MEGDCEYGPGTRPRRCQAAVGWPTGACQRLRPASSFEVRHATSEPILPSVLRSGPYRFFFYMADYEEPAHVHVERDRQRAKFWLDPVRVAYVRSFSPQELRRVQRIVEAHRYVLLEQWDAYFGV